MKVILLAGITLVAVACTSPGLVSPPVSTDSALSLMITLAPDPVPGSGLQTPSFVTVGVGAPEGAWAITSTTIRVLAGDGQTVLEIVAEDRVAKPRGDVAQVRYELSWDAARGAGRTLEISVTVASSSGVTEALSRRLAF